MRFIAFTSSYDCSKSLKLPLGEIILDLCSHREVWTYVEANLGIGSQEAYEEFKRVLLALMYDKNDENSPVAEEVLLSCFSH